VDGRSAEQCAQQQADVPDSWYNHDRASHPKPSQSAARPFDEDRALLGWGLLVACHDAPRVPGFPETPFREEPES
jgi:hypothetical protein